MRALIASLLPLALTLAAPCQRPAPERPLLVLVYHGLGAPRPYWVTPRRFEGDLRLLLQRGYHFVDLAQVEDFALRGRRLPPRPVLITFDDGDPSVYLEALPITRRLGVPAVLFVVGGRIGRKGFLDAARLRELQAKGRWRIEAHSYDLHRCTVDERGCTPPLGGPGRGEQREERRRAIERDVEQEARAFRLAGLPPPTAFAFPFGRHDEEAVGRLHAAYGLLFDSRPALARSCRFLLPRVDATAQPLSVLLRRLEAK